MTFYPEASPVPSGLVTGSFILEPLTPAHVELDYAAVMASKELLRLWSGTTWPTDDFTIQENLDDLERHDREHQDRKAFTYTVLSPDRRTCLGCVYINPLDPVATANPGLEAEPGEATVGLWVTTGQPVSLEEDLVMALRSWFAEWEFPAVSFNTRPEHEAQVARFRSAGLQERARVHLPRRDRDFLLFG